MSLVNLELIRDFRKEVTTPDIYHWLLAANLKNVYGTGRQRDAQLGEYSVCLMMDYKYKRANPFAYNLSEIQDIRFLNEIRKSANLTKYDLDFLEAQNNCKSVAELKEQRTILLEPKFEDYEDRRWQYFWVQFFMIPKAQREDYDWDVDLFFADTPDDWKPVPDLAAHWGEIVLQLGEFKDNSWKFNYD